VATPPPAVQQSALQAAAAGTAAKQLPDQLLTRLATVSVGNCAADNSSSGGGGGGRSSNAAAAGAQARPAAASSSSAAAAPAPGRKAPLIQEVSPAAPAGAPSYEVSLITRKGGPAVRAVVSHLGGLSSAEDLQLEVEGSSRLILTPAGAGQQGGWCLEIDLPAPVDADSVRAKLAADGQQLTVTAAVRG
jgi:hypothetical protein